MSIRQLRQFLTCCAGFELKELEDPVAPDTPWILKGSSKFCLGTRWRNSEQSLDLRMAIKATSLIITLLENILNTNRCGTVKNNFDF